MNEGTIRTTLVNWLKGVYPGVEVIRSDQVGTKPTYPFVAYRLDSIVQVGHDEITRVDANGIVHVSGQREATVSVHYFGPKPIEALSKAYLSLGAPSVQDAFSAVHIAINNRLSMQNVSTVLETEWEDHATFDFYIGLCDVMDDNVGLIEKIGLEQDYTTSTGVLVIGPKDYDV